MFHDQEDLIINVDYFSLEELKQQFEELLRAYRDFDLFLTNQGNQDNGNKEHTENLKKRRELADATFRAAFQTRLDQMPTVLSTMPFDQAIDQMVSWASQQIPRHGSQEVFHTVDECSSRLRALTSASEESSPEAQTYWPLIRKLRVYLNAYILSKGLIITDLPGLRDLNSARKAITERYVRDCHQIFVVARIDRAVTDESIKEIFQLARRANLSKVDVVCTRSEDGKSAEAMHDFPSERAAIEELQNQIDLDVEEMSSLAEEIEEYEQDADQLTRDDERELREIQQQRRKA